MNIGKGEIQDHATGDVNWDLFQEIAGGGEYLY